jgi:quercetin dioxygenase-like cupin family protein
MRRQLTVFGLLLIAVGWIGFAGITASSASPLDALTRTVFSHALPPLDGSHLQLTTVEVTYPPGGFSTPHSHPCPVIGYVLKGAVRMQVKGGPVNVFKAGDSFYEPPNGIHLISANASAEQPAIFLAYFLCDHAAPLSSKVANPSNGDSSQ